VWQCFSHSGIELPHAVFRLTNHWARKHNAHHCVSISSNFGSIFPFWDSVFRTNVR